MSYRKILFLLESCSLSLKFGLAEFVIVFILIITVKFRLFNVVFLQENSSFSFDYWLRDNEIWRSYLILGICEQFPLDILRCNKIWILSFNNRLRNYEFRWTSLVLWVSEVNAFLLRTFWIIRLFFRCYFKKFIINNVFFLSKLNSTTGWSFSI